MKIVISGGTGLIGRAFIQSRLNDGDEIIVLSRTQKNGLAGNIHYINWDAKTLGDWISAIDGADVIVNLAGENIGKKRWSAAQKEKILSSRVDASKLLVKAVEKSAKKPALFIQASAIGIYGTDLHKSFDENSQNGSDYLASVGEAWEKAVQGLAIPGVRTVVTRFGVVLDKNEGALPRMVLPFRLFSGGPLGSGQQWISWVHLDDVIGALNYIIENKGLSGVFNITSPKPLRNAEFGKQLAMVLNRPYWFPVPGFMLRMVLGEMSTLVLDGQKVEPKRLLDAGYVVKYADLMPAISDILK